MADLALMCKSHNYEFHNNGEFRVGNWVISESKRKELLGGTVILTETKRSPAYLGGEIIGFKPEQDGKKCTVIFQEDTSLVGNTSSVGHRGWGTGRGVCYINN